MISDQKATRTDIEPNPGFEIGWRRVQAALQGLIGLAVAAGLLGAFGDGWLSTSLRDFQSVPLSVTYQRFQRANAPTELVLSASSPLPSETLELGIGAELLDRVSIATTQPAAREVNATPEGVSYRFALGPERTGVIKIRLAPRLPGSTTALLSVAGERLTLPLLIYP